MISIREIQTVIRHEIDQAGFISQTLHDQREHLLSTANKYNNVVLDMWSLNIISYEDYKKLCKCVSENYENALEKYER